MASMAEVVGMEALDNTRISLLQPVKLMDPLPCFTCTGDPEAAAVNGSVEVPVEVPFLLKPTVMAL